MDTAIAFRTAAPADLARVAEITERAYAIWLPVLGHPPVPMTEDHAPRIARGEVLLACAGDRVLGLIVVESGEGRAQIFSVAVDPACSGAGIGQRLMAEAEDRARRSGKHRMCLYTNALMTPNIALYQRLGYRETGRRRNPARPVFMIVDMEKALVPPPG